MLETKRLMLRSFYDSDIKELFDYRNNEICAKYQRYKDTSKNYLCKFIDMNKNIVFLSEEEQHFAIALKSGEIIGDVSIYFQNRTITIGYTISYKHHRNGYAFETISALIKAIHSRYVNYEIIGMVEKENEASICLLEKLGFINDGYEEKVKSYIFSLYANQ